MKKKFLLSSILTIALCLSLIAGSTFALFTDTTDFNIAVTSGDVEVYAKAELTDVWSAEASAVAADKYYVDEFKNTYERKYLGTTTDADGNVSGTFTNGGTATIKGANLEILRLTPGDGVSFDIAVDNRSDVAIMYRYKIEANDTNLATGMVVTIDGVQHERLSSWTSAWFSVTAPDGKPDPIINKEIKIELPVYAGNEYQSEYKNDPQKIEKLEYTVTVEAVQGNAAFTEPEEFVYYPVPATISGANTPHVTYDGDLVDTTVTNAFYLSNAELVGDNKIVLTEKNAAGEPNNYNNVILENVTADVNGNVITNPLETTVILANCDFKLDAGELIVADFSGTATQVVFMNVTVNGERVTSANAGNYISVPNGSWFVFS